MNDVRSTLVDKIATDKPLSSDEKMVVLGALSTIDYRKFFSFMCQASAPAIGVRLARKLMEQEGKI